MKRARAASGECCVMNSVKRQRTHDEYAHASARIATWVSERLCARRQTHVMCMISYDDIPRDQAFYLLSPPVNAQENRHARGVVHAFCPVYLARHVLQSQTCPVTRRHLTALEIKRIGRRIDCMKVAGVKDADFGHPSFEMAIDHARFNHEREENIQTSCLGIRNEVDTWMNTMLHVACDTHLPRWMRKDMIKNFCKQRYLEELADMIRISVREAARTVYEHRKRVTFERVRQGIIYNTRASGMTYTSMSASAQQSMRDQVCCRETEIEKCAKILDDRTDWKSCWPHRPFACPTGNLSHVKFEDFEMEAGRKEAADAMQYILRTSEDHTSRSEDAMDQTGHDANNMLKPTFDVIVNVLTTAIQKLHAHLSQICMRQHSMFVKNVDAYMRSVQTQPRTHAQTVQLPSSAAQSESAALA